MNKSSFTIDIAPAVIDDLRRRVSQTRWPVDFANDQWAYGTNLDYLKELAGYWADGYDWYRHQRAMNQFANYKTTIQGVPIHFIHELGKGPRPIPIILSHGWPWTFWDYEKVIRPLSDPAAFGGDARDSFDVVVPSLPGYGFSTPLTVRGINYWRTADLWVELMQTVLGYGKFAAGGGDWGAFITNQLGHKYADRLIAIYLTMTLPLDFSPGNFPKGDDYAPHERAWLERGRHFSAGESGYAAIQMTKPQTLSYGINDSPAGLCAWILEKRRTWSDCGGEVEKRFSKDDLLTTMTLYWVTGSFVTSARYYYEAAHNPWTASHQRQPAVEAPTAVGVFPADIMRFPRGWMERHFNLQHWKEFPAGGHFAPAEEPALLVEDLREFFRRFR
ncbi:MAG TPA: epoxide hydrolase [Candidatus Binataceae bacterium]